MLPVNQFILSGSDPLFNSGNLNEQIQYLEEQKRIIDARQKQIQQVVNGQQVLPTQQQPQVSVWDLIDSEIEPLTTEQRNMLANNEEYVNNYNSLQAMVQTEVLNLVRAKIEGSPEGKALLDSQLKLVKNLKTSIIEMSQREMQLFNAFKEASAKNPSLTYDEFIKGNFDDMIFESAIDFWFDDVDFGEDKLWKYFNELK